MPAPSRRPTAPVRVALRRRRPRSRSSSTTTAGHPAARARPHLRALLHRSARNRASARIPASACRSRARSSRPTGARSEPRTGSARRTRRRADGGSAPASSFACRRSASIRSTTKGISTRIERTKRVIALRRCDHATCVVIGEGGDPDPRRLRAPASRALARELIAAPRSTGASPGSSATTGP